MSLKKLTRLQVSSMIMHIIAVLEILSSKPHRVCKYFVKRCRCHPYGVLWWGFIPFYRDTTPTGLKTEQVKNRGYPSFYKEMECLRGRNAKNLTQPFGGQEGGISPSGAAFL